MKKMQASVTVEAAFLVPFILMIISVTITLLFYCHDKIIIHATLHETAVVMSNEEDSTDIMIENYFREQIGGRLLLFSSARVEIENGKEDLSVECVAVHNGMRIRAETRMKRTYPEKWVRTMNNLLGAE